MGGFLFLWRGISSPALRLGREKEDENMYWVFCLLTLRFPLTVLEKPSPPLFVWVFVVLEPENCLKAAQNRQESGVASRLPWPVVCSIGAAAGGEPRLHPWAKDKSAAQGGCWFWRLAEALPGTAGA